MSLKAVGAIAPKIPENAPLLAALIVAMALEDLASEDHEIREEARVYLYSDHCAGLLAGLGYDAGNISSQLKKQQKAARRKRAKRNQSSLQGTRGYETCLKQRKATAAART